MTYEETSGAGKIALLFLALFLGCCAFTGGLAAIIIVPAVKGWWNVDGVVLVCSVGAWIALWEGGYKLIIGRRLF